jgi:pantoate kinase
MPVSDAFCPAGISSFFEICDRDAAGRSITDPARVGARGGGFALRRGITSRVSVKKARRRRIEIRINSKPAPYANTTRSAVEQLVNLSGISVEVLIEIDVRVPIAAGFGTSAAGTLASCLALSDASDLPLTFNELGGITHVAEVVNRTGLGTASALLCGGFVLVKEPGAPGIGLVDRLRFPPGHSIICAHLKPIYTSHALTNRWKRKRTQTAAKATMSAIAKDPTLRTFLNESRKFGERSGFETPGVTRMISTMMNGAIGAAQNMIGEAVHAVAADSKAEKISKAVTRVFPRAEVFISHIDNRGVRLLKSEAKH